MNTIADTYASPLGTIVIESDGKVLTGLRFADKAESVETGTDGEELPIITETRKWLDDYFGGRKPHNTPQLNPQGTDFQRKVWQALLTVGYGQTKTYGEIARMVGCRSAQAVGQAVGRNPIALIIPCHRLVGAHGSLGGYAFGIRRKERLLKTEASMAPNEAILTAITS